MRDDSSKYPMDGVYKANVELLLVSPTSWLLDDGS